MKTGFEIYLEIFWMNIDTLNFRVYLVFKQNLLTKINKVLCFNTLWMCILFISTYITIKKPNMWWNDQLSFGCNIDTKTSTSA